MAERGSQPNGVFKLAIDKIDGNGDIKAPMNTARFTCTLDRLYGNILSTTQYINKSSYRWKIIPT